MKPLLRVFLLLLLGTCLTPSPAFAHVGWWDWLEELSGPGPFRHEGIIPVSMVDWRVFCHIKQGTTTQAAMDGRARTVSAGEITPSRIRESLQTWGHKYVPCSTLPGYAPESNQPRVTDYVEVRYGAVSSDDAPLFNDVNELPGVVTARAVQGAYMRQVRGFSIGAGAGLIWFSGKNLDQHAPRLTITPFSVAVKPAELLPGNPRYGDLLIFRFELVEIVKGYKATDFNSLSRSGFSSRSELLPSLSLTINLAALLR